VPVGGGGLIAGIGTAVKALAPTVEIVGVEVAPYPSAHLSLAAGHAEASGDTSTLADGIAVRRVGDVPFAHMQRVVDRVVTVTEEEIASSVLALVEQEKTVAEGAGAVALAAVLEARFELRNRRVACVVSGGNIDVNTLAKIIEWDGTNDDFTILKGVAAAATDPIITYQQYSFDANDQFAINATVTAGSGTPSTMAAFETAMAGGAATPTVYGTVALAQYVALSTGIAKFSEG